MADCARCSVARFMKGKGFENVLQVIYSPEEPGGYTKYQIYHKIEKPTDDRNILRATGKAIEYDGYIWDWAITVFSIKHADSDCDARGRRKYFKLTDGFPTSVDSSEVKVI